MFDKLFDQVDTFIEAVRGKAHDAIDKGCEAVEAWLDAFRGKLMFAGPAAESRAADCRFRLSECEKECHAVQGTPGQTVGAGWDLTRVLKLIAVVRAMIDALFPQGEPAAA